MSDFYLPNGDLKLMIGAWVYARCRVRIGNGVLGEPIFGTRVYFGQLYKHRRLNCYKIGQAGWFLADDILAVSNKPGRV